MIIKYFEEPCPHYVIDEFLTPRSANKILEECINLEAWYKQAITVGDAEHASETETCNTCKLNSTKFRDNIRDNQTLGLDELYKDKRLESVSLTYLEEKLNELAFQKFISSSKSIFPILNTINSSETMLSRYGKCDFYGWHTDSLTPNTESRVVTISYYVNKEPMVFKGGDLLLLYPDGQTTKKVVPKHNRAVIFASDTAVHGVEYVDLSGKSWGEGRFSIQLWTGFNSLYKFR